MTDDSGRIPGHYSGIAKGVSKMLVLSRKIGEEIKFPGLDIVVQVVEVKRNGVVRLGVVAPKDVAIKRGELVQNHPPDQVTGKAA